MMCINESLEIATLTPREFKPDTRVITLDKECQVDINIAPQIRKVRNTTDTLRDTITTVSYKAAVSVEKAQVATQIVCKMLYGHIYQLEATQTSEPMYKKPRSAEAYQVYHNVLPSAKSINTFKHKKALKQEIYAAHGLLRKTDETKVTLHYDTTHRSQIDGDWPSIILNFSGGEETESKMIPLRPINFAYEDREQILLLITETLKRLSTAANSDDCSPKLFWEKIDAVMTDAASMNLKIEQGVAKKAQIRSHTSSFTL